MTELQTTRIELIFPNEDKLRKDFIELASRPLIEAFVYGAAAEYEMLDKVLAAKHVLSKETTAQQVLQILGIEDIGEWFGFELPLWMQEEAFATIGNSFDQPYWMGTIETTRRDIESVLVRGVEDGLSIREMARRIVSVAGAEYTRQRATLVARTEIPDALNSGHAAGIRQLNREVPELEIGKEWMSIFSQRSRASHMAMDGTVVPAEGNFTLNGVECTHPGAYTLPAKDRCNCLCTVLSSFVTNELGISNADTTNNTDASTQQPPDANDDEVDTAHNKSIPILQRLEGSKILNDKVARMMGLEIEDSAAAIKAAEDDLRVLHKKYIDDLKAGTATSEQADELFKRRGEIDDLKKSAEKVAQKNAKKVADALAVEKEARAQYEPTYHGKEGLVWRNLKAVVNSKQTKKFKTKVEAAEAWMNTITHQKTSGKGKKINRWFQTRRGTRGRHIGTQHEWRVHDGPSAPHLPSMGPPPAYLGMYLTEEHPTSVFVHELVHSIEMRNKDVELLTNDFVKARIARAGTKDESLQKIFPDWGYEAGEFGNEDSFAKAFESTGNASSKYYAGKVYDKGSTEVLTMGVELLYNDAKGFATRDPEYFKFIVGVLNGDLL